MISDPYTEDIRVFILVQDIDKEKKHQQKVKSQLENDSLTGLLNRGTVIKKIKQRLEQKETALSSLLIMIDVDRFKGINDNFGHQFGDQALSDIGQKIALYSKANDLCGRLGGDEFILLLSDINSLEQAHQALQELSVSLKLIYENGVTVSVSLGAVYPCIGQMFESLYNEADRALYRAKKRGRNLYEIVAPSCKGV